MRSLLSIAKRFRPRTTFQFEFAEKRNKRKKRRKKNLEKLTTFCTCCMVDFVKIAVVLDCRG